MEESFRHGRAYGYEGVELRTHVALLAKLVEVAAAFRAPYVRTFAGDLPLGDIVARFKADGYASCFSFEWEKKWIPALEPPERVFPQYVHHMRKLWGASRPGS